MIEGIHMLNEEYRRIPDGIALDLYIEEMVQY